MIFDTNVLIYLSKYILKPENIFSAVNKNSISVISKIECLGYNFNNTAEHNLLSSLCDELTIIPLSDYIAEETIRIRTDFKIKLPDAIIYATALTERVPLVTNNIADFIQLSQNVELINPFNL